ncbi:carboxypeptidase regulatory-like domain-containing protein [Gemmatimonadota bacterium]
MRHPECLEGFRFLRTSGSALLLGLWLSLLPTSLAGQEVRGRLLESETGTGIPMASVALLDTTMATVVETLTNEEGAFSLQAPAPGSYHVLAEALGYAPRVDGILEMGAGGSVTIEFYLRPKPIEMDSLIVALTRVRTFRNLTEVGYYDRRKMGFGSYITPEEIQRRNPVTAFDLLRGVPNLHLGARNVEGTRVYLRRGGLVCNPKVYVDGTLVMNDPHTEGLGPEELDTSMIDAEARTDEAMPSYGVVLEDLVNFQDISAVEVHTRATSIPLLYGGTQDNCGVILIWTHSETGKRSSIGG